MGISSIYNFRYDPDLVIGKLAYRRISCAYLTCLEILRNPWDIDLNDKEQPRYGFNKRCIYWITFKGCNNWRVVGLVTINVTLAEEEAVYEMIMHGLEARTNERILVGTFGAMRTNDEATQGC